MVLEPGVLGESVVGDTFREWAGTTGPTPA